MTAGRWKTTFSAFLRQYPEFLADSWRPWRSIGAAWFGETPEDPAFVHKATGRSTLPAGPVRASFEACGRGSGKTRFSVALRAVYFAVAREYHLAPGENVYISIHSPTMRQSGIAFRYIRGLLRSVPTFAGMIVRETATEIELSNGVVIEVAAADYRSVRGRSMVLAIIDEGAFLPTDDSATPDAELVRALRPALARVPGSMLVFVSSPYAQRGELYKAFRQHFGNDGSDVLVVKAGTLELNPTFAQAAVDDAYADDPVSAASEHGAEFRKDVETFMARQAIEAVVVAGRFELLADDRFSYRAFFDFAGGSGTDSATLAIAHTHGAIEVLDAVREVRPPFSPEQVCQEFATFCHVYRIRTGTADRWGGQFPIEQMRKFGVEVKPAELSKSDLYRNFLPVVNSKRCELLDHPQLVHQLAGLERKVARGGRDSIDHGPGAHDDLANVVAGVLVVPQAPPMIPIPLGGTAYPSGGDGGWSRVISRY